MGCGGVTIAMEFGIPNAVRHLETRAGLTPAGLLALACAGYAVCGGRDAGPGAGFSDEDFRQAGAQVVCSAAAVYGRSDVVLKATRPTDQEYPLFRSEQTISCFLHLSVASADLIEALEDRKTTTIACEIAQEKDGLQPMLLPMSEVAERQAPIIAGQLLVSPRPHSRVCLVDRGPNGHCRRCNDA